MITTVLLLSLIAQVTFASEGAPCRNSLDCNLNGDCDLGHCVCDPWWSGSAYCDVLSLLPARKADGYHRQNVSSWGGMSIQDPVTKEWHLIAAEMVNQCPLGSWKTNSRIIHAVQDTSHGVPLTPAGPFRFTDQVLPTFTHNPKVFRAPDGTYLIFYIGGWATSPQVCNSSHEVESSEEPPTPTTTQYPGPNGDGCGPQPPYNGGCGIAIASSTSLNGPWTTIQRVIVEDQRKSALLDCAHTNPSPWFFPDGSVVMAINAGFCHNNLETIGLLKAPNWRGPWKWFTPDPILKDANGNPHACEDPFLWIDHRGWHLLVHNQEGAGVSLYAYSQYGYSWVFNASRPAPYTDTIVWDDGSTDQFDVERPQFVFDPNTSKPLYLTNGAMGPTSFTLFRPL
eukprot:PhF_6_TR29280/c0_g1_i1/m.42898